MNRLTRIDEYLSPDEIFDAFYEACIAFMEWSSLFKSTIIYYCTSNDCRDVQEARSQYISYNEDHDLIMPKTILEGHLIDLGLFGIFPRNLYDRFFIGEKIDIPILPSSGVILPPAYLFEDDIEYTSKDIIFLCFGTRTLTEIEALEDPPGSEELVEHHKHRTKVYRFPVTKFISDGDDIDDTIHLLSEMIIKPPCYLTFVSELLNAVKYRFSVFQPMFVEHGFCGLLFPQIDFYSSCIYIPDSGILFFDQDNTVRDELPSYKSLLPLVESYMQSTYAKFDCIQEEIIRRGAVRKVNRGDASLENGVNEKAEKKRWSIIMTKKRACGILGWSMGTLNAHIAEHSGIARMQRNRQHWRFDCNDPSFSSLPLDDNFNKI